MKIRRKTPTLDAWEFVARDITEAPLWFHEGLNSGAFTIIHYGTGRKKHLRVNTNQALGVLEIEEGTWLVLNQKTGKIKVVEPTRLDKEYETLIGTSIRTETD